MAKSKRRFSSGTGPTRAESPRRALRGGPVQAPERPPPNLAGGRTTVAAPRPLVPEAAVRDRGRWQRLLLGQQTLVALTALVILGAIGLLLYAWYDQSIKPRRALAIEVGDRRYPMDYFAQRYKQDVEDPANAGLIASGLTTTIPEKTADKIETESVLLQRAGTLGVSAGDNEIDKEMLLRQGIPVVSDTPEGQETSPDDPFRATPVMEQAIRAQLRRLGLTLAQFREMSEAALLRQKAETYFFDQAPTRAPQVRVRVLQFPSESDSRIAIDRLKSGQSTFAELAESVSLDQAGKGRGGQRDWLPRGVLPKALDDFAFSASLSTLSEPIDSGLPNSWFLVEVLERTDDREVPDAVRKQVATNALQEWLKQQKEELGVKRALNEEKIRWAFLWVKPTLPQEATQPRSPTGLPPGLPGTQPQMPPVMPAAPPEAPAAPPPPPSAP